MPENLWPELSPEDQARIQAALARGQKIEAIKLCRDATGAGLKEAKDAIERGRPKDNASDVVSSSGPSPSLVIIGILIVILIATAIIFRIYYRSNLR